MSKELLAATRQELALWPDTSFVEEVSGKHRKIILQYKDETRLVVMVSTPGDRRAGLNHIATVRRELRGMGASKYNPVVSTPRPFMQHVPAAQQPFKALETIMKPTNKIEAIFSAIGDLRYGEMLFLAQKLSENAVSMNLRRNRPNDWAMLLQDGVEELQRKNEMQAGE